MADHGITWWTTHSLDKVFPDSERPPKAQDAIALKAARNETEDAQVIVRLPRGTEVSAASYELRPLQGPDGAVIAAECQGAYWEWYVYVTHNPPQNRDPATYLRKAPAFFPDAFLEETEIRIRDEWTQPLWFSVRVPSGTPPGDYRGSVGISLQVRDGDPVRIDVPVSLTVWPFELPDVFHLHHTEWFWPEAFVRYNGVELWSEDHWQWIRRVAEDMARHKQDMVLTRFTPWGGPEALRPSLVAMTEKADGTFEFDFALLDRWIETFKAAGVEWIEGGHVARRVGGWNSQIGFKRFPVRTEDGGMVPTGEDDMSDEEFERYVCGLLQGVHAHLVERGWDDKFVQHVADEPAKDNAESWRHCAQRVAEWLPGVRRIDALMVEELEDYCEWRVPQIQDITERADLTDPQQLWCYVCLAPQGVYPNRFLDYASIRNRIIFWLCWTLDLKGFLHWGYNAWRAWTGVPVSVPVSPWMDATGGSIYCQDRNPLPAGDPHIVYPGREMICSSVRWEVIRKGMEDYEYLWLLADLAGKAPAGPAKENAEDLLAAVRGQVAPTPATHTHDDDLLLSIREEIGEAIAALV